METNKVHKTQRTGKYEYSFFLLVGNAFETDKIERHLNKLELEVMLMEVDCIEVMGHLYQGYKNNDIFERYFSANAILDNLFNDLESIKMGLNDTFTVSEHLKKIENYLSRFRKNYSYDL